MTHSFSFVLSLGLLSFFLFLGVLLRKYVPVFQKLMLPSCILGGILGFILMNSPWALLSTDTFTEITYHAFNLSYLSLVLTPNTGKSGKRSSAFRGGLWMALISGLMISIQAIVGGASFLLTNLLHLSDAPVWFGLLIPHGFTQGTGQALAIGSSWEAFQLSNTSNLGLLYATCGFLLALFVGVPYAVYAKKKGQTSSPVDTKTIFTDGTYAINQKPFAGTQTTRPDNIDTLSLHLALLLLCYVLAYGAAVVLSNLLSFSSSLSALPYSLIFLPGMFIALLMKKILSWIHMDHLLDSGIQKRLTGACVDFLMVASMMSIQISLVLSFLPALILALLLVTLTTFIVIRFFANQLSELPVERFLCQFGCCMGTTASGLLLLRIVDPDYSTSCGLELVIFNILFTFTGLSYLIAPMAPSLGLPTWLMVLVINMAIMLILFLVFGFLKPWKLASKEASSNV